LQNHFIGWSQVYSEKKKSAEDQLENLKELCQKWRKKRATAVGALVSSHGVSADEVLGQVPDFKSGTDATIF
jgi:hypothetical protein